MSKYIEGAFQIAPMVSNNLCIRLNNWLHSRHFLWDIYTAKDEVDQEDTVFGFNTKFNSWAMLPLRETVSHLVDHGYDPYLASHLIGTFDEDRELEQRFIKEGFQNGQDAISVAIGKYNTMSFPIADSFYSNLSLISDTENRTTYLAWDQEHLDGDMNFWLKQMQRILEALGYHVLDGAMIEYDHNPETNYPPCYYKAVCGEIQMRTYYCDEPVRYEKEMMAARERAEKKVENFDLLQDDCLFMLIPNAIERNFTYYSGQEGCTDPIRYMTKKEVREDFQNWLRWKIRKGEGPICSYKDYMEGQIAEDLISKLKKVIPDSSEDSKIITELMKAHYNKELMDQVNLIIRDL